MMMLPIADIPFSVLAFDWIRMLDHVEEELSRRSYRFLTILDIHSELGLVNDCDWDMGHLV